MPDWKCYPRMHDCIMNNNLKSLDASLNRKCKISFYNFVMISIEGCVGAPLPGVEVRIAKYIPGKEEYEVLCAGNSQGTKVFTDGEVRQKGERLILLM